MKASNGYLVLSLDFELFWGVFDVRSLESYEQNLKNVRIIIPRLLELCETYNAKLSFATVGFLLAKTKNDILNSTPKEKPTYLNSNFNSYKTINSIGEKDQG